MSDDTLREVRALAFHLAPSGANRNPKTGKRATRAELADLADMVLRVLTAELSTAKSRSTSGGVHIGNEHVRHSRKLILTAADPAKEHE